MTEAFAKPASNDTGWPVQVGFALTVGLLLVFYLCTGSIASSNPHRHLQQQAVQACRSIQAMLYLYALDHGGKYPTGKSSTEVFQKLIDGKYTTTAEIFWIPMPGKAKLTSKILKPKNVCWDVTTPVDVHSPNELPVVFITGFRMTYEPGARVIALFQPAEGRLLGFFVCYKGNLSMFLRNEPGTSQVADPVISTTFNPAGQKFQQLTPEGTLAP